MTTTRDDTVWVVAAFYAGTGDDRFPEDAENRLDVAVYDTEELARRRARDHDEMGAVLVTVIETGIVRRPPTLIQIIYDRVPLDELPEVLRRARRGRYTYSTRAEVSVGDIVEVSSGQEVTVVAIGSDYDGEVDPIKRVIERRGYRP
jgi:hypothetical protein